METYGTTLIVAHDESGLVLAVDDRGYSRGVRRECQSGVKKFRIVDHQFVIGSVGVIKIPRINYEFETWVSAWVETHYNTLAEKKPYGMATALEYQVRETIHRMVEFPDDEIWKFEPATDLLITYVVAGYAEGAPQVARFGSEIHRKERKIIDNRTIEDDTNPLILGEQKFIRKACSPGLERDFFLSTEDKLKANVTAQLCEAPASLQQLVTKIAAAVKVEAHFNCEHVGDNVSAVVIDRQTGNATLARF